MKDRNCLNAKQKFDICKILDENRAKYASMTRPQVFEDIKGKFDFEINFTNVDYLCKQLEIETIRSNDKTDSTEHVLKMMVSYIDMLTYHLNVTNDSVLNHLYELRRAALKI